MAESRSLRLSVLPGNFAVCRLAIDSELPMWFLGDPFFALLRSDTELTVVCQEEKVPAEVQHESGWRRLKLDGVFAFTETGILESVLRPLVEDGVGIFALSSFATDYVLVKQDVLEAAVAALTRAGHQVQIQ
jgi:uncharacterized protein